MKLLKKMLLSLGIVVAGEIPAVAAPAEPDFAHPRKVIADAYATLRSSAGKPDEGAVRVRAVLELCAASQSIDPDSIFTLIKSTAAIAADEPDGSAAALMELIDAKLLNNAYGRKRWTYDRLETPAEPLPANIREWNGSQFRTQISLRASQAYTTARQHAAPLDSYAAAVEADRLTLLYFPTVADFVADAAIDLLDSNDRRTEADSVLASRCAAASEGSAPWYYWQVKSMQRSQGDVRARLLDFYKAHSADEYARLVLTAVLDYGESADDDTELIALIEQSLERFPGYWDNNSLRNSLAMLKQPQVLIKYPSLVCPGQAFDVEVSAQYADKAGVNVYSITPAMLSARNGIDLQSQKPLQTLSAALGGDAPEQKGKIGVTLSAPGAYAITPTVNGRSYGSNRYWGYQPLMVCSPYVPLAFTDCSEQVVAMADFNTGRPVEGVRVYAGKSNATATMPVGTTDKHGLARFRLSQERNYSISAATPQGQKLFFGNRLTVTSPWRGKDRTEREINASVMPARPIYHPGDTLQWVMVADYSDDGMLTRESARSLTAAVELRDANFQPVDTVEVLTDAYGRAAGSFAIPTDRLTGQYTLRVLVAGRPEGSGRVMVSDYRMPVFEITDINVLRDAPARGQVSITGRAVTYSGMPVADARVSADISEAMRWRWWVPSRRLGTVEATTDATGRFTLVVAPELLAEADVKDFSAQITVTSAAAETAEATTPFTTGRPYLIRLGGSEYIKTLTETTLPIAAYDGRGEKADLQVRWSLVERGTDKIVARGTCSTLKPVADLDRVHGGYYKLVVEPVDAALADKAESRYYTLYNVELNSMPADLPLLVEATEVETDATGRASFQYGVGEDDTWLYAALCVGREIVEVEVQKRDRGFRHLSLDLPKGSNDGVLKMATVRRGHTYRYSVAISRPSQRTLTVAGESFRDRLVPGAEEHWQLRVSAADGKPVEAAVAATMYNHSLDALASLLWPSGFPLGRVWPQMSLNTLGDGVRQGSVGADIKTLETTELADPAFRYWSSYTGDRMYGSRRMMMKSAATMSVDMAAPMMANAAMGDMAVAEETEEEGVLNEVVTVAGSSDGGAAGREEQFNYRDANVAEALWMPMLTTEPDGSLAMDFRVPDANTTWRLQALAWTEDMRSGTLVRDFVANRPVMVQPNLPRFLRQGDSARVLATVYNNSGSAAAMHTVVELFDPADMRVLVTAESTDTVAADGSVRVGIDLAAPVDATVIGYRVRSSNGEFSDGEQSLIPIESAQCDVVESTTFYLNPGDKEMKLKVPSDKSGVYTLQYCANPSWSVVKALPGLVDYDPVTTPGAVNSLFAACTARGIVRNVPMVAEAIGKWDKDDLTSRLEQNDALKIATLKATPWVQAAQSDSERMARLALLLDPKRVDADIKAALKVLSLLASADGGLRWGKWCTESSLWPTELALHDLGLLRLAGYLPDNGRLTAMMRAALAYQDRERERLDRDKKAYPDMSYAVVRSLWKDVEPSVYGKRVLQATIQDCIKNWRSASTARKANMAILLDIYGYTNVAREIISSVNEFAVATPSQGVSFPSVGSIEQYAPMLMAYGRIDPQSALIDGMRQWLVVREQATTGFGAADATQLVAAILNSGTPWHTDNAPASVSLRGRALDLGDALSYGGEATVALGADAAGGTIRIAPQANVPSYGALISSYRALPSEVKAASCDALSVEKRLVAVGEGGSSAYADSVALGSRVRVMLTLHVERDMEYVTIVDERAAGLEPVDQTPGFVTSGGASFYRENRDASTQLFIGYLPKGTYQISYDCTAACAGTFAAGLATVQSALAPALTAHSAGIVLTVR